MVTTVKQWRVNINGQTWLMKSTNPMGAALAVLRAKAPKPEHMAAGLTWNVSVVEVPA